MRALIMSAAVLAFTAGSAVASVPMKRERTTYLHQYFKVRDVHGKQAPGRQILKHGVHVGHHSRPATAAEVSRSIRTFRRWLAPPAPRVAVGDARPLGAVASRPTQAGGRWAIPAYIVQCESGGDYGARNPSGAGGAYQMMPGTFHAYGGSGDPASASPAEQDRVAGKIYAAQGASPWVCG